MAKIDKNSILHTFTGMLGRQIVVKRRLETRYLSAAPEIDPNRKPTSNQLKHQKKFTSKSAIAKRLANDPRTKPLYEAAKDPGRSAYHRAFDDAFSPPVINSVSHEAYTGRQGDKIFINATDDFQVASVKVSIKSADKMIEEGEAVLSCGVWMYTAIATIVDGHNCLITVTAYDIPGNEAVREISVDALP